MQKLQLFTIITIGCITSAMLNLSACKTNPDTIPKDLTPQEMVQLAQNATDKNNYKRAEVYYTEMLNRFRFNNEAVCSASYEIAFIHYKQKKWDVSRSELEDLLERYTKNDAALLPAKYKILAEIVLGKIDDRQNKSKPKEKKSKETKLRKFK
ncbi:MAG: hypothetical protein Ta2F_01660 [Termitinemataceae bacterium]|nr:MAG: hypothetical protein Ta2F_01660 [Termitinemataceae bacterium]